MNFNFSFYLYLYSLPSKLEFLGVHLDLHMDRPKQLQLILNRKPKNWTLGKSCLQVTHSTLCLAGATSKKKKQIDSYY